jgi:hypothetical protein
MVIIKNNNPITLKKATEELESKGVYRDGTIEILIRVALREKKGNFTIPNIKDNKIENYTFYL